MSLHVAWDDSRSATHYHIKWSHTDHLDWERFETVQAAEKAARSLVQPGEKFTIKAEGKDCSRCAIVRAKSASSS
jgi:hypothetical protein